MKKPVAKRAAKSKPRTKQAETVVPPSRAIPLDIKLSSAPELLRRMLADDMPVASTNVDEWSIDVAETHRKLDRLIEAATRVLSSESGNDIQVRLTAVCFVATEIAEHLNSTFPDFKAAFRASHPVDAEFLFDLDKEAMHKLMFQLFIRGKIEVYKSRICGLKSKIHSEFCVHSDAVRCRRGRRL